MPYEEQIQELLVLFVQYTRARSQGERARLEAEILQLFDTLGAALPPTMRSVRAEFDQLRSARTRGASPSRELRDAASRFAIDRIERIQRAPNSPALTKGAKDMLRIPLIELYETAGYRNVEETDSSIDRLLDSLRAEPHSRIEGYGPLRTSIAVIRAYAKNFCNIPPFCTGRNLE